MNVEQRPEGQEQNTIDLFVIRGHHLDHFYDLFIMAQENPDLTAEVIGSMYARRVMNTVLKETTIDGYKDDIQGPPDHHLPDRRNQVVRTWAQLFSRFLALPDDQVVRLHAGRDGVCDGCVIGHHCDTVSKDYDNDYTEYFISKYNQLNRKKKSRGSAETHYPNGLDSHTEHGLVVDANLGIVRRVFKFMVETSQEFDYSINKNLV